jgi:hypothetical protein
VPSQWDGLQIQWLLDPTHVDMVSAFALFAEVLTRMLAPD